MERPIDFSHCTIARRELVIPCEIECGKNYRDLKKFKDFILPEIVPIPRPKYIPFDVTDAFTARKNR
jgi:hypothetical protein